jgi:GT2 family glycosyltransferase
VIVVDNHSQDATVQKLLTQFPEVVLIPLDDNLGAAKASNIGFEYALGQGAEYILRLDSDTVVDPEFCLHLLDKAKKDPQIGVLSPKIYYYEPPDEIWFAGANQHPWHFGATHGHRHEKDSPHNSQVQEIDYVWGAAMLIKREVLEETGGFDPDFFVYYEEVDFCLRVKELGYKLVFIPDSHVWHKVGSSANNAWTAYHWNRSKMLLYRKHAKSSIHLISLVLFALLYAIISPVIHGKSGNRGPFRHALRGLWQGFKENL